LTTTTPVQGLALNAVCRRIGSKLPSGADVVSNEIRSACGATEPVSHFTEICIPGCFSDLPNLAVMGEFETEGGIMGGVRKTTLKSFQHNSRRSDYRTLAISQNRVESCQIKYRVTHPCKYLIKSTICARMIGSSPSIL